MMTFTVLRVASILLGVGLLPGCGNEPSAKPIAEETVRSVLIDQFIEVSARIEDGRTCLDIEGPISSLNGQCQPLIHIGVSQLNGGRFTTDGETYLFAVYGMNMSGLVISFITGSDSPIVEASSGPGYLVVAWPVTANGFYDWTARIEFGDGHVDECHAKNQNPTCATEG